MPAADYNVTIKDSPENSPVNGLLDQNLYIGKK